MLIYNQCQQLRIKKSIYSKPVGQLEAVFYQNIRKKNTNNPNLYDPTALI